MVSAASRDRQHSPASQASAPAGSSAVRYPATAERTAHTSSDSSRVRPGASPCQCGTEGGAPLASATRTMPGSTRRIRHDVVPSRNTSPAMDSVAQSSPTVPTRAPSGSASTRKSPTSGMAPPEVSAAIRAPRRPRSRPATRSRCR
jgi:hypothetical protein